MKRLCFMVVAGEPSGDLLAAELVTALRDNLIRAGAEFPPAFFGAGGPHMARAGVEILEDLTAHAVIGMSDVVTKLGQFRRLLWKLVRLAETRQPDVIVCVDFSGFNRRMATAIRRRAGTAEFCNWSPRIVQFVSPQVWASREGRVRAMPNAYDLLLTIFPFEKDWYAKRVPDFPVEFVGHPMVDRYLSRRLTAKSTSKGAAEVVLLPGSRPGELRKHMPVIAETAMRICKSRQTHFTLVLPDKSLESFATAIHSKLPDLTVQFGGIQDALQSADLAITKSGTVTMECAFFGVPAVVFYITSWPNYFIGKQVVKVKYLAMPNLLAEEELFPEFIQNQATSENLAQAALELLQSTSKRAYVRNRLAEVVRTVGQPGAVRRAAAAIMRLI